MRLKPLANWPTHRPSLSYREEILSAEKFKLHLTCLSCLHQMQKRLKNLPHWVHCYLEFRQEGTRLPYIRWLLSASIFAKKFNILKVQESVKCSNFAQFYVPELQHTTILETIRYNQVRNLMLLAWAV